MSALQMALDPRSLGGHANAVEPSGERVRSVPLALVGRFMRPSKLEYPAKTSKISVQSISLSSPVAVAPNERIVAYFEHIGGLEGTVSDAFSNGFTLRLNITMRKREKLAAQLTWLINRAEFTGLEERRHERFAVGNKMVTMIAGDTNFSCTLLDISLSGASLGTFARPVIGTEVIVGKQRAVVRRHHEQGIGVQFLQEQEASALQPYLE